MTKETKKHRSKRIRRHNISSPPRISSYDDTTTNVEDGSKYSECICKFIHILSNLCYLCSLSVVMMEINNYKKAPILGFGLFLFKMLVLDLYLFIMGKILYWPTVIDICAATVFGVSAIFNFLFSDTATIQHQRMFGIRIFTFGSLTVYIAMIWLMLFSLLVVVLVLIRISKKLMQNMTKKSTYG